jgi:hypothetical protein
MMHNNTYKENLNENNLVFKAPDSTHVGKYQIFLSKGVLLFSG